MAISGQASRHSRVSHLEHRYYTSSTGTSPAARVGSQKARTERASYRLSALPSIRRDSFV